ncbi:hypothetical protein IAQ61_011478 [Plenodomus lingam]|uniref:uncharacterized protein n=1 Tax=Leptosphaeria maculans TaxID=5022 RepID=UPI00332855C4|nr:hypothetical protein IAQ61_011478 [Plenodomus lingam]
MNTPTQERGRGRGRGGERGRGTAQGRGRGSATQTGQARDQAQAPIQGPRSARGRDHITHHDSPTPPPRHAHIHPATPVSIILKADQPTGHRVHGIVATLLTRGDHPRGVKVRLRDGRVGRVQALVSQEEGERGEALVGGAGARLGRDGEGGRGGVGSGHGFLGGRIERDARLDDGYVYDEERRGNTGVSLGLFAALEDADRGVSRRKGRGKGKGIERGMSEAMGSRDGDGDWVAAAAQDGGDTEKVATCPVCGEFEGDETAVAHHVEQHFNS